MKYFTITELCASQAARQKGISNEPTAEVADNLVRLTENVLDPLRAAYGRPITVNSGYRSNALNKLVGGVNGSQHLTGMAADIVGTPNTKEENKRLFELVRRLNLPFDQLIWEKGDGVGPDWVHISYDRKRQRRQVLILK